VPRALKITSEALRTLRSSACQDLGPLTISKELTKAVEAYDNAPPHVVVARRVPHSLRDRIPYLITLGRGNIGSRAVHPDEWDAGKHELDREWYAQQLATAMERLLCHCCSPEDMQGILHAGKDDQVVATGNTGILRALGARPDMVWRKRTLLPSQKQAFKKARQATLSAFLK